MRTLPISQTEAEEICSHIARSLCLKFGGHWEYDDLYSEAWVGLLKAVDTFDPAKSSFKTYCFIRVRGYVHDVVRDSTGRTVGSKRRPPGVTISLDRRFDVDYGGSAVDEDDPLIAVALARLDPPTVDDRDEVEVALSKLKPESRQLLSDYYLRDLPMKTVAKRLGISESLVSIRHARLISQRGTDAQAPMVCDS